MPVNIDLRDVEFLVATLRIEHRQAVAHYADAETSGRSAMLPLLEAQCDDLEVRLSRWEDVRAQLAAPGEAAPLAE
jgi:hypothetical protein